MEQLSDNSYTKGLFRIWGNFWGIVTLIAFIYISYESYDFISHPRMSIPDPNQDVGFGYILAAISIGLFIVTLANFSIIPFAGLPTAGALFWVICFGLTTWHWFHEEHNPAHYIWKGAVFGIGTVIPILLVVRSILHAKNEGRDPEEAAEDTIAQLSSKSWWHYLMYKNTRRQHR